MTNNDSPKTKLDAHVKAIEKHKSLLEQQHANANVPHSELKASLEHLAITLEEYLKVIGIP